MERWSGLLHGCVTMEIRGAEPEAFLNACAQRGLRFWDAAPLDRFTLRMTTLEKQERLCMELAARAQCEATRLSRRGLPVLRKRLLRRLALLLGLCAFAACALWSSLHIWEIHVTGNETLSEQEILEALDRIGVGIGSYWPAFTSDAIRSEALAQLPELIWLTVNVSGSRAEVIVRERTPVPEIPDPRTAVEIVAAKPGVIVRSRVYAGEREALPGQTVTTGDRLVSAAVNSSFAPLRFVHARAEVSARTWYTLTAEKTLAESQSGGVAEEKHFFSLEIGKKRINFYKSSGNFTTGCDKITVEHRLAWEGVFTLPAALVETRLRRWETSTETRDASLVQEELQSFLLQALRAQLGEDGSVTSTHFSVSCSDGLVRVTLHAECLEDIGRERPLAQGEIDARRGTDPNANNKGETEHDREDDRG